MKALAREALVVARDSLPEVSPHQAHYEELELVALRESNEAVAAAKSASGAEYRAALVAAAGALQRAEIYGEEAHRPDPPDANVVDLALASAKRYMRIAQETEGDEQTAALLGVRSQLQIMENHDDDPEAA